MVPNRPSTAHPRTELQWLGLALTFTDIKWSQTDANYEEMKHAMQNEMEKELKGIRNLEKDNKRHKTTINRPKKMLR